MFSPFVLYLPERQGDTRTGDTLTLGHRVLVVAVHRVGQVDDVSVVVQSSGDLTRLVVPQQKVSLGT